MTFNIGLTGIRSADAELRTTGNNIANASTVGFKRSRAEFGDVYASSILGSAGNATGSGSKLDDVAQQFNQGNISFTDNSLDLAINGSGFFILDNQGDPSYTRSGMFSTDNDGFIIDNANANLQGFGADENGNIINGVLTDLRVDRSDQPPNTTSLVDTELNLDATLLAPETLVNTANGTATLAPQPVSAFQTQISSPVAPFDFTGVGNEGFIEFTIAGTTTAVTLTSAGTTAADMATALNADAGFAGAGYFADGSSGELVVTLTGPVAVEGADFTVTFPAANNPTITDVFVGISNPASSSYVLPQNGYDPGVLTVVSGIGSRALDLSQITTSGNPTAREIAAEINLRDQTDDFGVTATASTQFRLSLGPDSTAPLSTANFEGAIVGEGALFLGIKSTANGDITRFVDLTSGDPSDPIAADPTAITPEVIADSINNSGVSGLTATLVDIGGVSVVEITAANGEDIVIQNGADSGAAADVVVIEGLVGGNGGLTGLQQEVGQAEQSIIGGEVSLVLDDGIAIDLGTGAGNIWGTLAPNTGNSFDPQNPETYNSATSVTIYDSLGNSHVMTQYFIKNRTDPTEPDSTGNSWTMIIQIDGQNVGNPGANSTEPTLAEFPIDFNSDGSLSPVTPTQVLITNWTPLDTSGNANGAAGPNLAGILPLGDDDNSSNFVVDITGSTQFGSSFAVREVNQDGFTTGRLTGLSIDDEGIMFARFTNGQAQVLGQVVFAGFTNEQGLQPVGATGWAETFESGTPLVGAPQTAAFGSIQSGALEDSNVDISEELVGLIIAQRNYQANAQTISTADETTQTILNI